MMILHDGSNGPTLISLPRDSDVEIPSFVGSESGKTFPGTGRHVKLNAAYAEDGPELLVRTVEHNTGLHIDHYVEIGFAGFANIVDAIGGVEIDIPKGGFKDRSPAPTSRRASRRSTASSRWPSSGPGTPSRAATWTVRRTSRSSSRPWPARPRRRARPQPLQALPDDGRGPGHPDRRQGHGPVVDLAEMFLAMKGVTGGDGKSMNMPISGSTGGNLVWDKAKVKQLVEQLKNDEKVTVTIGPPSQVPSRCRQSLEGATQRGQHSPLSGTGAWPLGCTIG